MKRCSLSIPLGLGLVSVSMIAISGCASSGERMASAVIAGDLAKVKRIAEKQPEAINAVIDLGDIGLYSTVLIQAIVNDRREIVEYLISKGVQLDATDVFDRTPLEVAINDDNTKIAELLLLAGAPVNKSDSENGRTPLHYAARAGNREIVELLLAHGAVVSFKDKLNKTPLDYALDAGHEDIARLMTSRSGP